MCTVTYGFDVVIQWGHEVYPADLQFFRRLHVYLHCVAGLHQSNRQTAQVQRQQIASNELRTLSREIH